MKDVKYINNDGTKAIKVLVVSNNQVCLNALCNLDHALRQKNLVSSGDRVNHNGGYLMHFSDTQALIENLAVIQDTVQSIDQNATIKVYNVDKPQPETL